MIPGRCSYSTFLRHSSCIVHGHAFLLQHLHFIFRVQQQLSLALLLSLFAPGPIDKKKEETGAYYSTLLGRAGERLRTGNDLALYRESTFLFAVFPLARYIRLIAYCLGRVRETIGELVHGCIARRLN